jgi:hypothetical protein
MVMKRRGRAVGSAIRDNLVELLFHIKQAHAYELYQKYKKAFGPVNIRSVYYNLTKGKELGVFAIKEVQKVEGDFSWGTSAERIIYGLGDKAKPKGELKNKEGLEL